MQIGRIVAQRFIEYSQNGLHAVGIVEVLRHRNILKHHIQLNESGVSYGRFYVGCIQQIDHRLHICRFVQIGEIVPFGIDERIDHTYVARYDVVQVVDVRQIIGGQFISLQQIRHMIDGFLTIVPVSTEQQHHIRLEQTKRWQLVLIIRFGHF